MSKSKSTPVAKAVTTPVVEETQVSPTIEDTPETQASETVVEATTDITTDAPTETPVEVIVEAPTEAPVETEAPEETEVKIEETKVEPEAEKPADELPKGPQARHRGNRLTKIEITPPATTLANITIEEVIQRKHEFDLTGATGPLKEIIDFIERYEQNMANSENVQVAIAESLQKQLFKNYLKIFTLSPIERGVAMECLLWKFFRNEKRVFRVSNLSRYTRNGKWNIGELQMYLQLNNIFNLVKDPVERIARLRTIELGATVRDFPSEKIQYTDSFLSWASTLK